MQEASQQASQPASPPQTGQPAELGRRRRGPVLTELAAGLAEGTLPPKESLRGTLKRAAQKKCRRTTGCGRRMRRPCVCAREAPHFPLTPLSCAPLLTSVRTKHTGWRKSSFFLVAPGFIPMLRHRLAARCVHASLPSSSGMREEKRALALQGRVRGWLQLLQPRGGERYRRQSLCSWVQNGTRSRAAVWVLFWVFYDAGDASGRHAVPRSEDEWLLPSAFAGKARG